MTSPSLTYPFIFNIIYFAKWEFLFSKVLDSITIKSYQKLFTKWKV